MSWEKSSVDFNHRDVKECCARIYESDVARLLLGNSFHPGGLRLTERLGELVRLTPESRVLDVASGDGTSAIFLAERFGCEVVGIDYSQQNVERANRDATAKGLSGRVRFEQADAESLPFPDCSFDTVACECAFCTFPEKSQAAGEFARVLRSGGTVGLSDLTREAALPQELDGVLAWVACIADAQPIDGYIQCLSAAGLMMRTGEKHDEVLLEMVYQIQAKLLGAEIISNLKKINLPGIDLRGAKQMAKAALNAVKQGQLGYVIVTAEKPTLASCARTGAMSAFRNTLRNSPSAK
jgi:arsenite methyltransferase